MEENHRIIDRLKARKSTFNVKKMQKDWERVERYKKMISKDHFYLTQKSKLLNCE